TLEELAGTRVRRIQLHGSTAIRRRIATPRRHLPPRARADPAHDADCTPDTRSLEASHEEPATAVSGPDETRVACQLSAKKSRRIRSLGSVSVSPIFKVLGHSCTAQSKGCVNEDTRETIAEPNSGDSGAVLVLGVLGCEPTSRAVPSASRRTPQRVR